nr:uncharacterized protein LOC113829128 [Penaeus vannamei]
MRELNLIDRCVLVVIMLVSTITMTAGGLLMVTEGYTEKALVFLVCGGTTSIFTCAGMMVSVIFSRTSPSGDAEAPLPYSDPPPEYRFTWREEYLKKSPDRLRTELEEAAAECQESEEDPKKGAAAETKKNKRKDIRKFLWSHEVSAVHSGRRNSVGEQPGTSSGERPRRGRATTVATAGSHGATRPEGRRAAPSRATISVVPLAGELNEGLAVDDEGLPTYEEVQKW